MICFIDIAVSCDLFDFPTKNFKLNLFNFKFIIYLMKTHMICTLKEVITLNKSWVILFLWRQTLLHMTMQKQRLLLRPRRLPQSSEMVLFNLTGRRMCYLLMSESDLWHKYTPNILLTLITDCQPTLHFTLCASARLYFRDYFSSKRDFTL